MDDLSAEERELVADNIAWFREAGPDDWHRAALDFNWDQPLYVLDWIVRQDDCDVATALTVFWLGEPTCWIEETQARGEASDGFSDLNRSICAYVAHRTATGGYTRSRIAFAPDVWTKQTYVELVTEEKAFTRPNFRAHPNLIRRRHGRAVMNDKDFYERYPKRFHCSVLIELPAVSPRSAALMSTIRLIEEKTRKLLPSWLRA